MENVIKAEPRLITGSEALVSARKLACINPRLSAFLVWHAEHMDQPVTASDIKATVAQFRLIPAESDVAAWCDEFYS